MNSRVPRWSVVVGALFLVAVGLMIGRGLSVEPNQTDGTTLPRDDDPQAFPRTEQGAIEAAEEIARALTGPNGDVDAYREGMESVAADQWMERAVELADNSIAFVNDRYGVGGGITFNPIRYRLASYSENRATVELWGVVLGQGPKIVGIEESWITGTIELTWSENQWKASGQASKGGPTPESLRTEDDAPASLVLEEFRELNIDE